jgi:predicted nucleic acid-binding protein
MIVVADTSPLNYLIQIDCDNLLPQLYKRVVVPSGVMQELGHASAPASVHAWLAALPTWIDVHPITLPPDEHLSFLDMGEREAIQLAEINTPTCCSWMSARGVSKQNGADSRQPGHWAFY